MNATDTSPTDHRPDATTPLKASFVVESLAVEAIAQYATGAPRNPFKHSSPSQHSFDLLQTLDSSTVAKLSEGMIRTVWQGIGLTDNWPVTDVTLAGVWDAQAVQIMQLADRMPDDTIFVPIDESLD